MPDSQKPSHGQSATFFVNGAKQREGMADGTEYRFDGLMEQWHDHLAKALTAHGREVHVVAGTITVMPRATLGES